MAKVAKYHKRDCTGGSCACPYRLDFRPQGVRGPRKRLEFPTKKAAERFLVGNRHKVSRGEYIDPAKVPTFREVAEQWFAGKTDRRPSHVADLRSRLDKHILPRLGASRLDRIAVSDIEAIRNTLRTESYAPRTINSVIRIISAVFRAAVRRGDFNTNPVDRVERAFMAAHEIYSENAGASTDDTVNPESILSPDEVRTLLGATTPGLYRALFSTAALTGARSGELFALRWGDIEISRSGSGYVYIRRNVSWARVNGESIRPRFYPPKTKAGVRRIPISTELTAVLRIWKVQCPPTQDDLVFPAADGRPVRRSNALRYGLWAALRRAGLRRVNMHSLRHSFASALIMSGASVTEVQALLGHANPAITLLIYSHWFKGTDSGAVNRLSKTVLGNEATAAETEKKWALRRFLRA
jgi:integrase